MTDACPSVLRRQNMHCTGRRGKRIAVLVRQHPLYIHTRDVERETGEFNMQRIDISSVRPSTHLDICVFGGNIEELEQILS